MNEVDALQNRMNSILGASENDEPMATTQAQEWKQK